MEQAGMSMHLFPSQNDSKTYVLMIYSDAWEDGVCIRTEGIKRLQIDTEGYDLENFNERSLLIFAMEMGINAVSGDMTIEDLTTIRETFARAFRASETLWSDEPH